MHCAMHVQVDCKGPRTRRVTRGAPGSRLAASCPEPGQLGHTPVVPQKEKSEYGLPHSACVLFALSKTRVKTVSHLQFWKSVNFRGRGLFFGFVFNEFWPFMCK